MYSFFFFDKDCNFGMGVLSWGSWDHLFHQASFKTGMISVILKKIILITHLYCYIWSQNDSQPMYYIPVFLSCHLAVPSFFQSGGLKIIKTSWYYMRFNPIYFYYKNHVLWKYIHTTLDKVPHTWISLFNLFILDTTQT